MLTQMAPEPILEECWSHKWTELKSELILGGKTPDVIKMRAHCKGAPFFGSDFVDQTMATSHPAEMQTEVEEMTVQEAVRRNHQDRGGGGCR